MSVQIARKVALAYWGFSKKATARAKSGIDIDIVKGNGGPGLEKATASAARFSTLVEKSWENYVGHVGGYGRIPFEVLLDLAREAKSIGDERGESDIEEVREWVKILINDNPNYFIAKADHKKEIMEILVNTKH